MDNWPMAGAWNARFKGPQVRIRVEVTLQQVNEDDLGRLQI
jgi:hypothetical protein